MIEELNLAGLMDVTPKEVQAVAYEWAKEQAATWPYGTYSPNDLVIMYQKGYLKGWLAAQSEEEVHGKG